MTVFGLGLEEIVFILLLILVIFAPSDIQRAGQAIGRGLNRLARSETWRLLYRTGEELRALPGRLMKEAQLEEWRVSTQGAWRKTQELVADDSLSGRGDQQAALRESEMDDREES